MVKMKKLNNDGTPFMFEGEEVIREFEDRVADNITGLNNPKWVVIEDSRKVKSEPRAARVEESVVTEEPKAEEVKAEEPKKKKKAMV